jgi:hypothetical protein
MGFRQFKQNHAQLYNRLVLAVGITAGALAGYLYYRFVGCTTGSCPITARPLSSTLYGALMGGLLAATFKKENKKA